MCCDRPRTNRGRSLVLRLTLWYAGMSSLSAAVVFVLFSLLIAGVIRERTDQDLLSQVRTFTDVLRRQGVGELQRTAVRETRAAGVRQVFVRLLYPTGEAFSSSNMAYWKDIGVRRPALRRLLASGRPVFETIRIAERRDQVRVVYGWIGPGVVLQAGQSLEAHDRLVEAFWKIGAVAVGLLMLLAALVGGFMARRAMAGVAEVTRTAARIADGALDERVPAHPRDDEIDRLARTFNRMLDRIEILVTGIRQMSDNIAHDLRSPITRIRGAAEVTLTTGRDLAEYEQMAASTIEECDRLLDMINTMLLISRTEAGVDVPACQSIDLAALVRDACELFQPLVEDAQLRLDCQTMAALPMAGDRRMLQRMVANLIDNAIKYTPPGGRIDVALAAVDPRAARLTVADTGCGIPSDQAERIFERFYRGDRSRSRGGVGLGLSLARTIARAHGGDITLDDAPGAGSVFTVDLPLGQDTDGPPRPPVLPDAAPPSPSGGAT